MICEFLLAIKKLIEEKIPDVDVSIHDDRLEVCNSEFVVAIVSIDYIYCNVRTFYEFDITNPKFDPESIITFLRERMKAQSVCIPYSLDMWKWRQK